jgi:hypothetical protein
MSAGQPLQASRYLDDPDFVHVAQRSTPESRKPGAQYRSDIGIAGATDHAFTEAQDGLVHHPHHATLDDVPSSDHGAARPGPARSVLFQRPFDGGRHSVAIAERLGKRSLHAQDLVGPQGVSRSDRASAKTPVHELGVDRFCSNPFRQQP